MDDIPLGCRIRRYLRCSFLRRCRIRRYLRCWFLRRRQFPRAALEASHTILPFPLPALRFAAVELTEGIFLRNLANKLSCGPIPDFPKEVHGATAIAESFTRTLRASGGNDHFQLRRKVILLLPCPITILAQGWARSDNFARDNMSIAPSTPCLPPAFCSETAFLGGPPRQKNFPTALHFKAGKNSTKVL